MDVSYLNSRFSRNLECSQAGVAPGGWGDVVGETLGDDRPASFVLPNDAPSVLQCLRKINTAAFITLYGFENFFASSSLVVL